MHTVVQNTKHIIICFLRNIQNLILLCGNGDMQIDPCPSGGYEFAQGLYQILWHFRLVVNPINFRPWELATLLTHSLSMIVWLQNVPTCQWIPQYLNNIRYWMVPIVWISLYVMLFLFCLSSIQLLIPRFNCCPIGQFWPDSYIKILSSYYSFNFGML